MKSINELVVIKEAKTQISLQQYKVFVSTLAVGQVLFFCEFYKNLKFNLPLQNFYVLGLNFRLPCSK